MSKVQGFIEKRQASSQGASLKGHFENEEGVQTLLDDMGIHRSVVGTTNGTSNVGKDNRPLSRQALAAQSKVPTPTYLPPIKASDQRNALRQSKDPFKANFAARGIGNGWGGAASESQEARASKDPWETDTSRLDDTSSLGGFQTPPDVPIKSEAALEFIVPLHGRSTQMQTSQTPQKPHDRYFSRATASPGSERHAETLTDRDGDDEYDDASQHTDMQSQGVYDLGYHGSERAGVPTHGNEYISDELFRQQEADAHRLGQASRQRNVAPNLSQSAMSGYAREQSPATKSAGRASMEKDELESKDGNIGPREFEDQSMMFRSMANPAVSSAGLPIVESQKSKRKLNSELSFGEPDRGLELPKASQHAAEYSVKGDNELAIPPVGIKNQKLASSTVPEGLDYDIKTLPNMSYQQLAEESFDTDPDASELDDPSLTSKSTLKEKLLHLHSLDKPREQLQSLRQGFFSSLPINEYEECGDLMAEQFSQVILRFKRARQEKRGVAREFENEVTVREKAVERRKMAVTKDLARLKRAGQDVVQGR
ncbi:MAG: hypothetical protein Q9208_002342 [Pyrenodesmia sp. 3 TL-2023]